jgi:hypothetical protein
MVTMEMLTAPNDCHEVKNYSQMKPEKVYLQASYQHLSVTERIP